jgi:hypothetical protein
MIVISTEGHPGGQTGLRHRHVVNGAAGMAQRGGFTRPSRDVHEKAGPQRTTATRLPGKNSIFCGSCRRQAFAFRARL